MKKEMKRDNNLADELQEEDKCYVFQASEKSFDEMSKEVGNKILKLASEYPEVKEWKMSYDVCIFPYIEETDESYNRRIAEEKKRKQKQEEKERKLLEKLKKKYEL